MERTLTLLRVRGIPIGVNWSWLFIVGLITWVLGSAFFPATYPGLDGPTYLTMAVVAAVLFFSSILAHELAHALVGLREGVRIEGITLWLLGGVARFTGGVPTPGAEFRMTIVGPLTSLVIAGAFLALGYTAGELDWPVAVRGVLEYLGRINLIVAGFNLVPALPLDGGRVLRSWLWRRTGSFGAATESAARAGRIFGLVLIWVGLLGLFTGSGVGGLWFAVLGWFLIQAATAEAAASIARGVFAGRRVGDVMTPDPATVDAATPLDRFVEAASAPRGHSTYPVVHGERLAGLVSLRMAGMVPPERRSAATVADVMTPADSLPRLALDAPAADALDAVREDPGRVVVVDDGRVAGIVSRSDLARAIEVEQIRGRAAPARRAGVAVWVVVALVMASAAGFLYHPPVAVLSPAPAVDVVDDIFISGVPVSSVSGRYVMTPVRLSRPSALGALYAAFDPNRDVVPLSAAFPVGSDPDGAAREQHLLFRESQLLATVSAARAVGMDVALTGSGARVVSVLEGSPASGELRPGDVIVEVNGVEIRLASDLRDIVASRPAGTAFTLAVERGDLRRELAVRSARLDRGERGVPAIGVSVDTRGLDARLPFEIEFRERAAGGPSAGLAFALAIADLLDPEDLSAGRTIAATGTVDAAGTVGPVGGLAGKSASAKDAGATIMFVSAADLARIPEEEGIQVRGVDTLAEALDALRTSA